jgi:hypothetical protein
LAALRSGLSRGRCHRGDDVRVGRPLASIAQAHRRGGARAVRRRRADHAGGPHLSGTGDRPQATHSVAGAGLALARVDAVRRRSTDYLYREVGARGSGSTACRGPDDGSASTSRRPGIEILAGVAGDRASGLSSWLGPRTGSSNRYFGLLPDFIGRRVGRAFLDGRAPPRRGAADTTRVWLHTCTLDHPRALPNYRPPASASFRGRGLHRPSGKPFRPADGAGRARRQPLSRTSRRRSVNCPGAAPSKRSTYDAFLRVRCSRLHSLVALSPRPAGRRRSRFRSRP